MERFGPATLVRGGGVSLLFDAGRGVTQCLWQARIPLGWENALFPSHLHPDHVMGLPDLLLTGWLTSPFGQRPGPLRVLGPPGTARMTHHLAACHDMMLPSDLVVPPHPHHPCRAAGGGSGPHGLGHRAGGRAGTGAVERGALRR